MPPDPSDKPRRRRRISPKTRAPLNSRNAQVWACLRDLKLEPFTVRSLAEKTGVRERTVSGYVTALFRANIIRQIDPPTMTQQGTLPAVYRAARVLGPLPPLIRYAAPGRPANDPNLLAPVRS